MKKFIILLSCLVFIITAVPCNRCIPEHGECDLSTFGGECLAGTKCTTLANGDAKVCLKTVSTGDACNGYAYNPCPDKHYCHPDLQTCQLNNGIAAINDGCTLDDDCSGTLRCVDKKCSAGNSTCLVAGCPLHQKCEDPFTAPKCVNKGGVNADCTSSGDCWMSTCIAGTCRAWFTAVKGGDCESARDCEKELQCERRSPDTETKCHEPILYYLENGGQFKWGRECDPTADQGCLCNLNSGATQLLIEYRPAIIATCKDAASRYFDCLANANCYQEVIFQESCLRTNCYPEYIEYQNQCENLGLVPVRCAASGIMFAVSTIMAILFL